MQNGILFLIFIIKLVKKSANAQYQHIDTNAGFENQVCYHQSNQFFDLKTYHFDFII